MIEHEKVFLDLLNLGIFSIDAEGRVWRHFRRTRLGQWKACKTVRADRPHPYGYRRVRACIDYQLFEIYAHRLVWLWKVGEIPPELVVSHKDITRPDDNRPSSLELVPRSVTIAKGHTRRRAYRLTPSQRSKN
jgi:hypothetical protein